MKNYGWKLITRSGGGDQDHPKEERCEKAKRRSEEAPHTTEKRRGVRGRGEREDAPDSAQSPRGGRRASSSEQCEEIEGDNRVRQARDLFKKTGATRAIAHAKTGATRDGSCVGLTEARAVRKRRQEDTEELRKKASAVVQEPSYAQLFVTPQTAARQASLSFTVWEFAQTHVH